MVKTAAGVYTDSPAGAVASTVLTPVEQWREVGGGLGDTLGAKWGEKFSLVGNSTGTKFRRHKGWAEALMAQLDVRQLISCSIQLVTNCCGF